MSEYANTMDSMLWEVSFYTTSSNRSPVQDFIFAQPTKVVTRIIRSIELLEKFGPFLRPPYSKKLTYDLYELRVQGRIAIRIMYAKFRNKFILIHAFVKKTQKTPARELEIALDRLRQFL